MSRHRAREYAFMLLYAYEVQRGDEEAQRRHFLAQRQLVDDDLVFFAALVDGVGQFKEELDQKIAPNLVKWELSRLPLVDLTILRLAVFEMLYLPEVPRAAAISESVLLARRYSSEESRAYINAVLGSIARELPEPGDEAP